MLRVGESRIGTLRLMGAPEDTPALRLAVSSRLGQADLSPPGMPPAAVLVVRRLADPLPGRLMGVRGPGGIDAAWEQEVRQALADLCRRAAGPSRGQVPGGAEAVLFADESEMLACLALDLSRGEAGGRWWWRVIWHTQPRFAHAGLAALLCSETCLVPAIMHHLARWEQVVAVLSSLSPQEAQDILAAMSQAHGLGDLAAEAVPSPQPFPEGTRDRGEEAPQPDHSPSSLPLYPLTDDIPKSWLQELPPGWGRRRQGLLELALTVYQRPGWVRTPAFRAAWRRWWASWGVPLSAKQTETTKRSPRRSQLAASPPLAPGEAGAIAVARQKTDLAKWQTYPQGAFPLFRGPEPLKGGVPGPGTGPERRMAPSATDASRPQALPEVCPAPARGLSRLEERFQGTGMANTALSSETAKITQLGGVFYLLNLMRHLGLPACFEEDWGLASRVGAWGVLEALGRSLVGPGPESWAADPIWQTLAELDGREPGKQPGTGVRPGNQFRLPAKWVAEIAVASEPRYRWAASADRLRLWSEGAYLLVEVPRDGTPSPHQAARELLPYLDKPRVAEPDESGFDRAPVDHLPGPLVRGLPRNLKQWLARVMPYIRYRLVQTLPLGSGGKPDLKMTLLGYRARLYLTATHVDLVMSLNDISLPVRLAGLDCDPGWLPDFGRVVKFHFE